MSWEFYGELVVEEKTSKIYKRLIKDFTYATVEFDSYFNLS